MPTRRDFLSSSCAAAAAAIVASPRAWGQAAPASEAAGQAAASAAAPASSADPLMHVNPEFRQGLARAHLTAGGMGDVRSWLPADRAAAAKPDLKPVAGVREVMIPGAAGAPAVRVYVVGDAAGASKPAVLHIHGGGYVLGHAYAVRDDIAGLAASHNCVVVTVEYRLAPETPFPGSLEDNYAALRWMHTNAKELGIDVTRIAVKGESAGGGHAAALAIAARDRGEFKLCLQVLIYPMLDDRTGSTQTLPSFMGAYVWTPAYNRFGWSSLLGVPAGSADVPQNAVPARVSNLAGLAPAWIGVGSVDLFAPEDLAYAQRLMLAGVPVEVDLVPGGYHGFDSIAAEASLSKEFKNSWNEALRRAFEQA